MCKNTLLGVYDMIGMLNMVNAIPDIFSDLKTKFMDKSEEDERIINSLQKARNELHKAEVYFENVTEPDLIDHAIYNMEAAKIKYMYLLKQARKKKLKSNI